jgi:uncharacterized repeat protein (TIGR02543 family)
VIFIKVSLIENWLSAIGVNIVKPIHRFRVSIALLLVVVIPTFFEVAHAAAAVGTTVTFIADNGQTPIPTATQVAQTSGSASLSLFTSLFPSFSYSGDSFSYWSTQPGGGGQEYRDGDSFPFTGDATLYAQWIGPNHTVTFAENDFKNDLVVSSQVANTPTPLTLFTQLQPSFSNTNYSFGGWNTSANGTGYQYSDGAVYRFNSAIELYAQWIPNSEAISFSANSGVGSVPSLSAPYGSTIDLPSGTSLTKAGYSFVGWNTTANGSGAQYAAGQSVIVDASETFFAMWSRDTYIVSFETPGIKGKVAPISVAAGDPITLRSLPGIVDPGYSFAGWFTSASGGQRVGGSGESFTPSQSETLFAQWTANPTVGLEFSSNGGLGHISARKTYQGLSVVVPNGAALHRSGFIFRGWASSPRALVPNLRIGERLTLTHDRVIYALWRRVLPPTTPQVLLGSVGIFAPNSASLTPAMRHYIASMAVEINRHNRTIVLLYGYASSRDAGNGSALLSLQRALAVKKLLNQDLSSLNDVGVTVKAVGEGRLTNSVLSSFRNVEVYAN